MFVIISFGILAFALAGAFVVWFYELFSNTNVRKERNKSSEGIRGSSYNDKLLYQEKLNNVSEYEELPAIEENNNCIKNLSIRQNDDN
uniref:Col_cuticle_N domain-containing protein n=1 Tax=Strongyloides papillosus TaxID=174720 RepID=A0A0N5BY90_STREA